MTLSDGQCNAIDMYYPELNFLHVLFQGINNQSFNHEIQKLNHWY